MAGGGLGGQWKYDKRKRLKLKQMDVDIDRFVDSLTNISKKNSFYWLATRYISARIIKIASLILADAAKRCPYDTGQLRESGRVWVKVGTGGGRGKVAAKVTDGASETPKVEVVQPYFKGNAKVISTELSFHRIIKGRDLALWAHEELLHYVKRPKTGAQIGKWYSRHYRTGPKYLENAFKLHKKKIPLEIRKGLMEAVRAYNKKWGTKVRRKG